MKLKYLINTALLATSVLLGLSNSLAFGQPTYPSTTAIEQARIKLKAELRSLQNSDMASYISDRRSPAEKQARNNFVNAWKKVDPDVAPFIGQWLGHEIRWNIHPSSTKNQVCIMMGIFGAMYVEMGQVVDGNIYTETGGVIFKEGDYLGIAAPLNNNFFSGKSEFPFRHPTSPREPIIYEDIEDRNKAEQVIQEYKNAGCTASLPSSVDSASAQNAILKANNPDSRINLRSAPTTNSRQLGYGLVGDSVNILERSRGSNGYTWYKVQFPRSQAIGWIRGDFVNTVITQGGQNQIMQKARTNFNQQVQSLKNSSSGHRLKDRRTSAQIKEKDNFVTAWQKVDPQTAPFLGSWSGYETVWSIYPSNKKGRVCVISSEQGFINLYLGKIVNNELHFNTNEKVANHNNSQGINKKYIAFREGNYLGMGYIQNNQFMQVGDLPLNSQTIPRNISNFFNMNGNRLSSSSLIVQSFKNAGCSDSLPSNTITSVFYR